MQPLYLIAAEWYSKESNHFKVIYREPHAHLVPRIMESAEKALTTLTQIFNYQATEKIIINTYDFSDYGKAGTTTLPKNFIRLEIAPLELSYEVMPYNDRIQWIISHELVHVIVNDQATKLELAGRKVFSKVPPESDQPLTTLFSFFTSHQRFSPRWHQEGIAVFMETWLSGGYGRILGNFDEMYFRSMVSEQNTFPDPDFLEAKISHHSFLLETLFYLYGARFCAYLSNQYGKDALIRWYRTLPDNKFVDFESKFKNVFGLPMDDAWTHFTNQEKQFQDKNIERLRAAELTKISPITEAPVGWVTSAYFNPLENQIIFANHKPHHLTAINKLDLNSGQIIKVGSISSPSMIEIASTAYDPEKQLLFYTTNNNKLFRDLCVLSLSSQENKVLFRDSRIGQITVSPVTHELYGIRHEAGRSTLVYSAYPYRELLPLVDFGVEANLQHLAISPSGKYLSATLHKSDGSQAIILANLELLKEGRNFSYRVISADGSPEHASWSPDEKEIYWNAYINGVSNIYRYDLRSNQIEALSHTMRGLFRPVYLNADSLFAYEFTTEGFRPVIIPNKPAEYLPAIQYYGQTIIEKHPEIRQLPLNQNRGINPTPEIDLSNRYSGLKNIHIHSLIPVVTGFQSHKVFGLFTHWADPLYVHDISIEAGFTPYLPNKLAPRFHFRGKYEYKRKVKLTFDHNAPDFFDLFNQRKKGMIGNRATASHTMYWKYDIPHKIKQVSEVAVYSGIKAINDNLVIVKYPDFMVLQSAVNSSNTRRSIGSVNNEKGTEWSVTGMFFGVDAGKFEIVGGLHSEAGYYTPWLVPHNILHIKLSGGYRHTKSDMAIGKFYFGGFGNRYLETEKPKQYGKVFRFSGIPIYDLPTDRFLKCLLEHNLPPYRPGKPHLGHHYLSYIDFSWYGQGLWVNAQRSDLWYSIGTQLNLTFKHWYNLESTLSFGAARAWFGGDKSDAWFASLKLFKK